MLSCLKKKKKRPKPKQPNTQHTKQPSGPWTPAGTQMSPISCSRLRDRADWKAADMPAVQDLLQRRPPCSSVPQGLGKERGAACCTWRGCELCLSPQGEAGPSTFRTYFCFKPPSLLLMHRRWSLFHAWFTIPLQLYTKTALALLTPNNSCSALCLYECYYFWGFVLCLTQTL